MHLGSHEKHNLPLTLSPERPLNQPCVPGRPSQGVRLPLACCHSPQPFLPRNTFRQPDNPAWLLQGGFYPAPSLALRQRPKNAVSHPETHSGICLGGNHSP